MKATQRLHDLGQSIWLDNITRGLLVKGTLRHYITELSVTGLTSNPTIFDQAIKNTDFYNDAIRQKVREGKAGEDLFFELALEDLTQAADLFRPIYDATGGMDGWASLEVSPLSPMIRPAASRRRPSFTARQNEPTSSSRFRGPPKEFRRSRKRSSRGCP
jgi:transaldolase